MENVINTRPVIDFQNNVSQYLKELKKNKKPLVLTENGKSAAVLLSAEQFQEMQDQLDFMRKVAQGLEDYKNDRVHSVDETFGEIEKVIETAEKRWKSLSLYVPKTI